MRTALSFAYLRAGHYHAAAEQLLALLKGLPPGEEADRTAARLRSVQNEIIRERYWDADALDMHALTHRAGRPDAPAESKMRLAHAQWALGDQQAARDTLAKAKTDGYAPRAATVSCMGEHERDCQELSDVHVLIAGGLECIVADVLRFLPFADVQSVRLGPNAPWRPAEVVLRSGEELEAAVPVLYRFSVRSANDLIQSARFTQFRYEPGEGRYAQAIGTRSMATEDGVIPFTEVGSVLFR